jgi:HEAT repeat protein
MKKVMTTLCSLLVALLVTAPLHADFPSDSKASKSKHKTEKNEKDDEADARAEQESDLYDEASDALDDNDYSRAIQIFRDVVKMRGEHQDAAMYWLAYAQNKNGNRSDALATVLEFQKAFPKSRWMEDVKVLEVELRQSAGQHIEPSHVVDEDVKIMALQGLMNSDPERGVVVIEGIINDPHQPAKLKDKAIFLLSQYGGGKSAELLGKLARDHSHPDLQERALRYLGIMGGEQSRRLLAEVYQSSSDMDVKRSILKSFMISGDRGHLLSLAKTEPNPELRAEAVQQLGIAGGRNELADLYANESSIEVKKKILQAMFIGGSVDKLSEIARTERNPELRLTAIKNLGLTGGSRTGELLVNIYETDTNSEVRHAVINALFLQSNAKALVSLARKERDPDLKKSIISKLSIMGSKEAAEYLMEFLKD